MDVGPETEEEKLLRKVTDTINAPQMIMNMQLGLSNVTVWTRV